MLSTKPPFALGPAGGCAPFAPNPLKGAPSSPEGTTSSPIAPQPVDEVDKASAKLAQYMESQALATTADARASTFGQIRPKLRDVAFQFAESFKIAARAVVEQSLEMGRLVLRMKTDLKRSEYRIFLSGLGWTQSKVNKYAKIALRFEGFAIEQLCGISLDTLFALCAKIYDKVVEQLRSMQHITQEAVEQMMKQARPPRTAPKRQQAPVSGWRSDLSGGGRHYELHLYDEPTAMEIERRSEERHVLPQRVIADAIAASSQLEQVQEELKLAVDEMRDRHIQMQKQILERDGRISYLEQLLAQHGQRTQKQEPELPKIFLFPSTTWEYFALLCGHNRSLLWGAIKDWSASERAKLPPLLAAHLEEKPNSLDEVLAWVPEKLARAAMHQLPFIVGNEHGCRFVSFEYLNTSSEQWIFQSGDNKLISLLGRSGFEIERLREFRPCL